MNKLLSSAPIWLEVFQRAYALPIFNFCSGESRFPCAAIKSKIFGPRLTSLPFVTYGGFDVLNQGAAQELLDQCLSQAHDLKVPTVEIRGLKLGVLKELDMRGWFVYEEKDRVTFWLKLLPTIEAQWKGFNTKVRNHIKKAEKSGLKTKVKGLDGLNEFYAVHSQNMKDLGSPVHSKRFFQEVMKVFGSDCRIFCVYKNNRVIAASLAISYARELLEVPWSGVIRKYNPLCPNSLLYWSMIQFAVEQQMEYFDFGRCTKGSGTYQFKKQWKAEEKLIYWYTLSKNPIKQEEKLKKQFSMQQKIWSKLPLCITNLFGPCLRKQISL